MFFTRIGKVIAHLIFWLGLLRIGSALFIAFTAADVETNAILSRRYLGTSTTGEALSDKVILYVVAAIALGVLCEVSAKQAKADAKI
jgi:hypothetical protein